MERGFWFGCGGVGCILFLIILQQYLVHASLSVKLLFDVQLCQLHVNYRIHLKTYDTSSFYVTRLRLCGSQCFWN